MPRRKCQNTGNSAFFSRAEAAQAGYGSSQVRLSGDSQLRFGECGVCLRPVAASEALCVTPSGRLYHRPCLVQFLGEQTLKLKRQRAAYEEQQERMRASDGKTEAERIEEFKASETTARRAPSAAAPAAAAAAAPAHVDALAMDRSVRVVAGARDKWAEAAKSTSFWRPEARPSAAPAVLTAPPKRPPSPNSSRPIRLRDVTDLRPFRVLPDGSAAQPAEAGGVAAAVEAASADAPSAAGSKAGTDVGRIACALTHTPIRHQRAVAVKS